MQPLEVELERARALDVDALADRIESVGFECTRCGACCRGDDDEHTATVFPDEIRALQSAVTTRTDDTETGASSGPQSVETDEMADDTDGTEDGAKDIVNDADGFGNGADDIGNGAESVEDGADWRDVARPMPFGLSHGESGPEGETFEWALQTDDCGDCVFYDELDGIGACTAHSSRALICRTYPFSVTLDGTAQPMGEAVDERGVLRIHECEGVGRDIDRESAESLARTLRERAIRELEEAIAVREAYEPVDADSGTIVVHDSEGAKRPDGSHYRGTVDGNEY